MPSSQRSPAPGLSGAHVPAETGSSSRLRGHVKSLGAWFMQLPFRRAIWLAPLAWAIHEAEEWNINVFERAHFRDPGYFALVDHPVLWLGLAQVALLGVLWTLLTAWPRNPRWAAYLTLPFFVYVPFANVLQHVYTQLRFGGYTPGIITAVCLVGPVVLGLTFKAVRSNLIPWWYAVLLYLTVIPTMVSSVRAGDSLPPQMIVAQQRGIRVARMILGRESGFATSGTERSK